MTKKDFFYELSQRNREYSRGEYFSTLDVIDQLEGQNTTLNEIRKTTVDFYRSAMPEAFAGLDRLAKESAGQTELLSEAATLLSEQSRTLGSIDDQLFYLRNSLDMGFERLCSRIDRSNEYLSKMVEILSNPVKTQASEFARRANKSLQNGWYDEALSDLNKVIELDPFNYVAWYYIGVVSIEQIGNKTTGEQAFIASQKYAKPESAFYYSSATLQLALISYSGGNAKDALAKAEVAFNADKSNMQAAFLLAELHSGFGQLEESSRYLQVCEVADIIFYLKSSENKALVKSGVHKAVYDKAAAELRKFNAETRDYIGRAIQPTQVLKQSFMLPPDYRSLESLLQFSDEVSEKKDYIACRMGHDKLISLAKNWQNEFSKVEPQIRNTISHLGYKISAVPVAQKQSVPEGGIPWWGLTIIGVGPLILLATIMDSLHLGRGREDAIGIVLVAASIIFTIVTNKMYKRSRAAEINESNARREMYRDNEISDLQVALNSKSNIFQSANYSYNSFYGRDLYTSKLIRPKV